MRILFLSPFPAKPLYGGAVVRNHYLARALLRRHEVWASFVGCSGEPEFAGEVPLRKEGLPALFDPGFLGRAYREIRRSGIEAIVGTSLIAGLHGALLKLATGCRFWMDEHNVEWHCSRRYGHRFWWLIFLLEGFVLRVADDITCVSEEDRERLIKSFSLDPRKVVVAPNGVDFAVLSRVPDRPSEENRKKRILFFGVLDYPPNRRAVEFIGERIAPRIGDEVELLVAGRGGEDLVERYPGITFLGFVNDIHALVYECDGLLVPIFSGGGTRMKILETIACGLPVVSTACGAEGIDLKAAGEALSIVESADEMIAWIERLPRGRYQKPSDMFKELYDWETIWQNSAPL